MGPKTAIGLLALVLLLPTVVAEPPKEPKVRFTGQAVPGLLEPERAYGQATVRLEFSCSQDELLVGPTYLMSTQVSLGGRPTYASTMITPHGNNVHPADPRDCTDDRMRHSFNHTVEVSLTRKAPGFVPIQIPVFANLTYDLADGSQRTYGPFRTEVTVTPDYFGKFDWAFQPIQRVVGGAGQPATFDFTLTVFANAASTVAFGVLDSRDLYVILPTEMSFDAPSAQSGDGAARTSNVTATVLEGRYSGRDTYPFHVRATLAPLVPTQVAPEQQVYSLMVFPHQLGGLAPGPELGLVLISLAWFSLRRRGLT